jgi:hypothetical protein
LISALLGHSLITPQVSELGVENVFLRLRWPGTDGKPVCPGCTNGAEGYFSRLRRGEQGHHHHIAGPYLVRYAQEAAWREDLRRVSNGEQTHSIVGLAMRCRPSVDFCGYWQRAQAG